jgi:hypothetical protein
VGIGSGGEDGRGRRGQLTGIAEYAVTSVLVAVAIGAIVLSLIARFGGR